MADATATNPFEALLTHIIQNGLTTPAGKAAASSDSSGEGTSDTGENQTKSDAPAAKPAGGASQQAAPMITPHALTDMILNQGQIMPVMHPNPAQGSSKAPVGLDDLGKILNFGQAGGSTGANVAPVAGTAASTGAGGALQMGMKLLSLVGL